MSSRLRKKVRAIKNDSAHIATIIVVQAVFVLVYIVGLTWHISSNPSMIQVAEQIDIWRLLTYIFPIFLGPLLGFLLLKKLISKHIGASKINFKTYVDNHFYSDFVRFSAKHRIHNDEVLVSAIRNDFKKASNTAESNNMNSENS